MKKKFITDTERGNRILELENIVDNLMVIIKANKTIEFAKKSIEHIAKACLFGDLKSGVQAVIQTGKYAFGIRDILFWDKMKTWLQNTYDSPEMEVKMSSKFTEDEKKYKEYTKRQIQFIAQVDEEEKVELYANLTRAWLLGYIDTALYFKMSYLLKVFTLEELWYLKDNYTTEEIRCINFYIKEFSLYGLIETLEMTNLGNTVFKYTELAKNFVQYGLDFSDNRRKDCTQQRLENLNVENTKTFLEWGEF